MKQTKKALFTSLIALILCFSMLLSTTFAWFTDEVKSSVNQIVAGNLDVELYWSADAINWEQVDAETNVFMENALWEPGHTEVVYLKIVNAGTLDLKYQLGVKVAEETGSVNVNGDKFKLSDYIMYGVMEYEEPYAADQRDQAIADVAAAATKLNVAYTSASAKLEANNSTDSDEQIVTMVVYMPTSVGNEANYAKGENVPTIKLGIHLYATQVEGEFDSFGEDYDADATYPVDKINVSAETPVAGKVESVPGTDNVRLTETMTTGAVDGIYVNAPAGVLLPEGEDSLKMEVETKPESEAVITVDEGERVIPLDVHVNVAPDNEVPVTVTLPTILPKGLNLGNVKLYHVENGATVQMTEVATLAELDAHNEFYYNAATGDVVLSMANFSEVAVVANEVNHWDGNSATAFAGGTGTEADPYLIANASQLAYFRDIVDGKVESWTDDTSFDGKYLKLTSNIFLNHEGEFNNLFDPIGWGYSYAPYNRDGADGKVFKGTFDGGNYSIHGLWQNGWDLEDKTGTDYTYTNCGGGLFASAENATFKNLGLIDFVVTYECVEEGLLVGLAQGNCTFENIYVFDSKIANYQRPVGGIVGEISPSYTADGTAIECTFNFKNIVIDTSVVVGTLWGDFDAPVGGVIGARWDDSNVSKVVMEDVNVACELDVYNDVTSTYQWYAYRRAGMLIGNTDTAKTIDGRTVATADFLTCVTYKDGDKEIPSVNVYYTNWAKYNYCQFTNYNSSWPWVRVQAGENCNAYSNPRYGVPNDVNGNKVVDYNHVHKDVDQCNVQIYFNQLYGGGQGVYGQPSHPGVNTDVKYLITFIHQDHVGGIQFITEYNEDPNGDGKHDVMFPVLRDLPHLDQGRFYEWIDRNGEVVNTESESIPVGNQRDIFYYLTYSKQYYVHFVDKDGFQVDRIEFDPKTGELKNGAEAPEYPPEVPGYYGFWEPYTLMGATHDVIVNAVYSKRQTAEVLTTADQLFDLLSRGHELSMSQDLSGGFGSANKDVFCTVVNKPDVEGDTAARFDLNSFTLQYNGDSSANKDWTLFLIKSNNKLTVGDGLAGFGFLYFDLSKLNGNAKPCIFHLEKDATLILERGVVIEFRYPKNNNNTVIPFSGVSNLSQYSGLQIENIETDSDNIIRITVTARTVLVGDGTDARS